MANSVKPEKKVHHLNIFLIKPEYSTSDQIIRKDDCESSIVIPIAGYGESELFVKRTPPIPPKWTSLFEEHLDLFSLAVPGASAALFIQVKGRCFVLAFGHSGRFLLRDDVFEERFGLLCALNSVDPKSFRCVDVQSLDAIQSHTRIQSGQETTPDQFGLDVEQDMLKAIVGTPMNSALGSRMTGNDSLAVSVRMDLSDLPILLDEYRKQFESELSEEDYQWVYNISMVKNTSKATIIALENKLANMLASSKFDDVWLSIPEIIDWTLVKGFTYTNNGEALHPDINLQGFLSSLKANTPITLDLMRTHHVNCADADHKKVFKHWSIYKCLYAEIDLNEQKYILNDGKWFKVAQDFVSRTDSAFASIPLSDLDLPVYTGGGEGEYNILVGKTKPNQYAVLDQRLIQHGGGHGKVEVCDLISVNKHLVHVKIYGKSSVFSHLFAQGFVSGQLIQTDGKFREKVRKLLHAPFQDFFKAADRPAQDEFTIVYAVISDMAGSKPRLPFFSKVNLVNTRRILQGFGYKVELLKISVDETFAKTTKVSPKLRKKKEQGRKAIGVDDL